MNNEELCERICQLEKELSKAKEIINDLDIELSVRDNIKVDKLVEKYKYYKKLANSYQANCISKDEIKQKIEVLEMEIRYDFIDNTKAIKVLKDLLGEENE